MIGTLAGAAFLVFHRLLFLTTGAIAAASGHLPFQRVHVVGRNGRVFHRIDPFLVRVWLNQLKRST